MTRSIKDIQIALAAAGFDPGPADGVRGRRTTLAITAFQKANGLTPDGVAGEATARALFGEPSGNPEPWPWMTEAMRILGWHEVNDNKKLAQWMASDGHALGDPKKLPWCGDFVETCILRTLPNEPVPANPYYALNWNSFGVATTARVGAILTFKRDGGGHVGFYVGETGPDYVVLGGNQGNRVSKMKIAKKRCRAIRWPSTVPVAGEALHVDGKGLALSTNEA